VRFGPGLDHALLQETLAVERDCCPFLGLAYAPSTGLLTVSVDQPALANALDAVVFALGHGEAVAGDEGLAHQQP
jgi:hypothetical protein